MLAVTDVTSPLSAPVTTDLLPVALPPRHHHGLFPPGTMNQDKRSLPYVDFVRGIS